MAILYTKTGCGFPIYSIEANETTLDSVCETIRASGCQIVAIDLGE